MSRAGDVIKNPVTRERAVVRLGTEETGGQHLAVELSIRPRGAVAGEHFHPAMEERFTVMQGRVGFRLDGQEAIAPIGEQLVVTAGMVHDWWNAGADEALVRVEVRPGARFEEMIQNLFGLAQDGKTNAKGMPSLLQLVAFAREFEDVLVMTKPPRIVQRLLFGVLAPLSRARGGIGAATRGTRIARPTG
jgi:quercetin dioxygenase-like cupin family protein